MKFLYWDLYFTWISSPMKLNVFWNDACLRKTFRAATFASNTATFPLKYTDRISPSEGMDSWNALGKIISKISGNVGNINEPRSVLSASFHVNGNTNDACFLYCFWKNISIFANYNNSIFWFQSFFGVQKNSSVCLFVIASEIWHFFDFFGCNPEIFFIVSKIRFSSLKFWSKVDLLSLFAQKSNRIHLVIKALYKLTPLFNFMVR